MTGNCYDMRDMLREVALLVQNSPSEFLVDPRYSKRDHLTVPIHKRHQADAALFHQAEKEVITVMSLHSIP
jgi:hypothetical protein